MIRVNLECFELGSVIVAWEEILFLMQKICVSDLPVRHMKV